VVRGNVESRWPVHGSLVISRGAVYLVAGRSSYVDGGLRLYALDAATGRIRHFTTYETAERESNQPGFAGGRPNNQLLRGAVNDLLVHDGKALYLKNLRVDADDLTVHPALWPYAPFTKERPWQEYFRESPLVSTGGFLDDSLYDRTCYVLDQRHSARKIAFDEHMLVGLRWDETNSRMLLHNHFFELGRNRYTVFAAERNAPLPRDARPRAAQIHELWAQAVDMRVTAMVMTARAVFAAGAPMPFGEQLSTEFARRSIAGREGAVLVRLAREDGRLSQVCRLPALPVWDGIAATREGLFITLQDGKVFCLR